MKSFWQVDLDTAEISMTFSSNTPREAALKAATRDAKVICLVEPDNGKLHLFRGDKVPLSRAEQNGFTEQRGITSKPVVTKMAYTNLKQSVQRSDLNTDVAAKFRGIMFG